MLTIVLDTNILISAIVFGGKPRDILGLAIRGEITLALSDPILKELQGVLEDKKFQYPRDITNIILNELIGVSKIVSPHVKIDKIKNDLPDNRILECAMTAKADAIISGDSDLLDLETYEGISILSASQFLAKYGR